MCEKEYVAFVKAPARWQIFHASEKSKNVKILCFSLHFQAKEQRRGEKGTNHPVHSDDDKVFVS
jgi:hypothetical protein